MQIRNDSQPEFSLYHLAMSWARTDEDSYSFAEFVRDLNSVMGRIVTIIRQVDGTWQWDDDKNDIPQAWDSLLAGEDKYKLEKEQMVINRLRIMTSSGQYRTLVPKDLAEISDDDLNGTGEPQYYDKRGSYVYLYPKPSYSMEKGIELFYQRSSIRFNTTEVTAEPAIDEDYHELAAMWAALDYCEIHGIDKQAKSLRDKLGTDKNASGHHTALLGAMQEHYMGKEQDGLQRLNFKKPIPQVFDITRENRF
jgi:hypothetical protein